MQTGVCSEVPAPAPSSTKSRDLPHAETSIVQFHLPVLPGVAPLASREQPWWPFVTSLSRKTSMHLCGPDNITETICCGFPMRRSRCVVALVRCTWLISFSSRGDCLSHFLRQGCSRKAHLLFVKTCPSSQVLVHAPFCFAATCCLLRFPIDQSGSRGSQDETQLTQHLGINPSCVTWLQSCANVAMFAQQSLRIRRPHRSISPRRA